MLEQQSGMAIREKIHLVSKRRTLFLQEDIIIEFNLILKIQKSQFLISKTVLPLEATAKNNSTLVEEIRPDEPVSAIALRQWQATWESGGKWFSMTIKQLRKRV